jgi:hypothetical protein
VSSLIAIGVLVLLALTIVCFAAYKIKARKFEVSTSIWKLVSLRITILSSSEETEPDRLSTPEETEPDRAQSELKP